MIYKCKNCGNNVAKEAILCENCGQENPAELVEQSLKATPLNPSEKNQRKAFLNGDVYLLLSSVL